MKNKSYRTAIKVKVLIGYFAITLLPFYAFAHHKTKVRIGTDSITIKSDIKKLATLGKIWGLLKYHHPAITERSLDWDQELLKLLPSYLNTNSSTTQNQILVKLVNDLGPLPTPATFPDSVLKNVKMKPNFSWMKKSGLSQELVSSLEQIGNYHTSEKQKYVLLTNMDNIILPTFINEQAYSDLKYPSVDYRLLATFRYWNIVEYWYPYKDLIQKNWELYLEKFIVDALNAKDELGYVLMVQKMVASIQDSHAYVISKKTEELKGLLELPFTVKFIEDKAVVNAVNTKVNKDIDLKIGVILTQINGIKVREILDQKRPYVSASNETIVKREVAKLLTRTTDSLVNIDIIDLAGKSKNIKLSTARIGFTMSKKYDFPHQQDSTFFLTKENILYINVGTFKGKDAIAVKPLIPSVKGIIIDARQYPRAGAGSVIKVLTESLLDKEKKVGLFSTVIGGFPGYFKYVDAFSIGATNPNYFKGLVTVLVNEETQSTSEFLTMFYQLAPFVKVVGSTTSGADGNVIPDFRIPGGFVTIFTGIGVHYPNKGQTQQIGIIPDVKIQQTIKGLRAQKDELMEKAISLISSYQIN